MSTVKHSPQAKNHLTNPNRTTSSKNFQKTLGHVLANGTVFQGGEEANGEFTIVER